MQNPINDEDPLGACRGMCFGSVLVLALVAIVVAIALIWRHV